MAEPEKPKLSQEEKKYLLHLARKSIEHFFSSGNIMKINQSEVLSKRLLEKTPSFVTFYLNGKVRERAGIFAEQQSLASGVIFNTFSAAFSDKQHPLSLIEFHKAKITITVTSKLVPIEAEDEKTLLRRLQPNLGVVLEAKGRQSTFFPYAWKDFPKREDLLSRMCLQAGFDADAWKNPKTIKFYQFETEEFSEEEVV